MSAGSWNTSSFVAPRSLSASYHARFVGAKTVKGPSPSKSGSSPVAASASENTPTSRSTLSPLSSSAIVGRPGILRRYDGGVGGGKGARAS